MAIVGRRLQGTLLVAIAIGGASGADRAAAAWPGRNGPIVFTSGSGCQFPPCPPPAPDVLRDGVWRVEPSGGGLRQLFPALRDGAMFSPTFKRSGELLLGTGSGFLFTDADARMPTVDHALTAPDPRWRADGQVAFSANRTTRTRVRRADHICSYVHLPSLRVTTATESALLPTTTRYSYAPAFSARGRLMAYHGFDSFRLTAQPHGCLVRHTDTIWVQRVDRPRSGRRVLVDDPPTSLRRDVAPDFSPDGRRLAVVTSHGVSVVDLERQRTRRLRATRRARGVAWSPDGRWLAVTIAASRAPARTRLVLIPARAGPRRTLGTWAVGRDCVDCGLVDVAWQSLPLRTP